MTLSTRNKITGRLKAKLISLGAIVLSAGVVAALMALAIFLFAGFLPSDVQTLLRLLTSGDLDSTRIGVIELFDDLGSGKVYLLFAIQVAQVLLAPIPGQITGFLMGLLLGFWQGILVAMSGIMVGSFLAMLAGRFFRNSFVGRFASNHFQQFDHLISSGGAIGFFIVFLLPFSPDDAVAFIAGLARVNIAKLMLVAFLGRLPSTVALVYAGSNFDSISIWATVILGIGILIAVVGWLFDHELTRFASKFSSKF